MRKLVLSALVLSLLGFDTGLAQVEVLDSFADGDFTSSPTWTGDTGSWVVVEDTPVAAGTSESFTLKLNASEAGTNYLSLARGAGTWGTEQSWGFWIGRRSGVAFTITNRSLIWLYANETNLESSTVDGYRLLIGDNSGDDEIILERVTDGTGTPIITSSGAITNNLADIGFLVRVTRTSDGLWTLYTSTLPSANGEGALPTDIPSAENTNINQGSETDLTYTIDNASTGAIGVVAIHTSSEAARGGQEFDQFYFDTDANSPLPVELVSFDARVSSGAVNLSWATASETNNAGFEIQQQHGDAWTALSFVPGAGTTVEAQHYSYTVTDLTPGLHRFRLKQVDYDGQFEYSPVVEVAVELPDAFLVSTAYPNPLVAGDAAFSVTARQAQPVQVALFDVLGRQVAVLYAGQVEASQPVQVRVGGDLAPGLYLVRVQGHTFTHTQKLLVQ